MRNRAVAAIGLVWVPVAALLAVLAASNATSSGRGVLIAAGVIGVGAAAFGVVLLTRDRQRSSALAFFISAIATPSGFAYAVNLIPLALSVFLVVEIKRRSRTSA